MSILLIDLKCPKCNKISWINNGNPDDTVYYCEAVYCAHCNHPFWIDEETKASYEDPYIFEEKVDINDYADKSYKTTKEAIQIMDKSNDLENIIHEYIARNLKIKIEEKRFYDCLQRTITLLLKDEVIHQETMIDHIHHTNAK